MTELVREMAALVGLLSSLGKLAHIAFLLIVVTQLKHPFLYNELNHLSSKVAELQVAMELSSPVIYVDIQHSACEKTWTAPLKPLTSDQNLLRALNLVQEFALVNVLLLCNNAALNPGPEENTCAACHKNFKKSHT